MAAPPNRVATTASEMHRPGNSATVRRCRQHARSLRSVSYCPANNPYVTTFHSPQLRYFVRHHKSDCASLHTCMSGPTGTHFAETGLVHKCDCETLFAACSQPQLGPRLPCKGPSRSMKGRM